MLFGLLVLVLSFGHFIIWSCHLIISFGHLIIPFCHVNWSCHLIMLFGHFVIWSCHLRMSFGYFVILIMSFVDLASDSALSLVGSLWLRSSEHPVCAPYPRIPEESSDGGDRIDDCHASLARHESLETGQFSTSMTINVTLLDWTTAQFFIMTFLRSSGSGMAMVWRHINCC